MRAATQKSLTVLLLTMASVTAAAAQSDYWPTDAWRRSSPEAQGMDSRELAALFQYVRERHVPIHSLLIVRNGYIVLDAYFWPFADGQLHDVASVTKSVTSTLTAITIAQRRFTDVHEPLVSVFGDRQMANHDARKDRVTLEHLLTMTSGLACRFSPGEITLSQMMASQDWTRFMLDLPMAEEPGSHYEYCSGGMHLLSAAISHATGLSAAAYAQRELFAPLGIRTVEWPADPEGVTHGWGDLHLQPRDMAKLGYLWLHQGRWAGRQLIPVDLMRSATEVYSHPGFTPGQQYGYGLWIYPERTPPEFEALGRGGQRITVVPMRNIVVVFTGGGFEPGDIGQFIGRSVKSDRAIPETAEGTAQLSAAVEAAAREPAHASPAILPPRAASISGKTYVLDENPLGIETIVLTFDGGSVASVRLHMKDRSDPARPVGLDGIARLSADGRFGLPVASTGEWENADTFVLNYDEVGNINAYTFRMTFSGREVDIRMSERTGLVKTQFHGHVRD